MAHGDCGSPAAAWCTSQRSKARRGRSSSTANCGATRRSRRAWCPRLCPSSWIPRPRRWARRAVADSVLLIDDDSDVLRAVGDYFDRIGYEVARADAAEPGFEAFERMRPTVVILDLHLPDLDGLELLERLRAQGGSVILLTGHGDIATAVRAMQLGAGHFLPKPVDLNHPPAARSSRSTRGGGRPRFSNRSCSGTSPARSPTRRSGDRDWSSWPIGGRSFSTRSGSSPPSFSPRCSSCSRPGRFGAWAARVRS